MVWLSFKISEGNAPDPYIINIQKLTLQISNSTTNVPFTMTTFQSRLLQLKLATRRAL